MKRIITAIMLFVLLCPGMLALAQETPEPVEPAPTPARWVIITRTVIFIGDELVVMVNGTANTTVSLELRPYNNVTMTYGNATYVGWNTTTVNGTGHFRINTDNTEQYGSYGLVLLRDRVIVAQRTVTINYDPIRWLEILIGRLEERIDRHDSDIQVGVYRDAILADKLERVSNIFIAVVVLFVAYILLTSELYLNYHLYKRKKAGKRPYRVAAWLLSGDNSEFFTQGGGIIYDPHPVLPRTSNGVDLGASGMVGMNTKEMIKEYDKRLGGRKAAVQRMKPAAEDGKFFGKLRRKKIRKAETDKDKPATYIDLCTDKEVME